MPIPLYQLDYVAPFGKLSIQLTETHLTKIDLLACNTHLPLARCALASHVTAQLDAYFQHADFVFNLALADVGTPHQRAVWQTLRNIPYGQTETYGTIAQKIGSSAQAVGQACGQNPFPILIPCHRVVAKKGLGGFFHRQDAVAWTIKHSLLKHEQR